MDIHIKFDDIHVKETTDIGTVRVVMLKGEQGEAGVPTQQMTNTAVADYLDEHPEAVTNIPDRIKQALLACFAKVAWIDAHGQDYYDALEDALYTAEVVSISAVFTQGENVILDTHSIDSLKQYLTVTASYDDGTTGTVTAYELSGSMTAGEQTFTVSYDGKSTTFTATVKHNYADLLANWALTGTSGAASYADGEISLKCMNASQISSWANWAADRAKTLWSDVEGKTLKIRIRVRGNNFGSYASDNRLNPCVGIYKNASVASLGSDNKQKYTTFVTNGEGGVSGNVSIAPPNDGKIYEGTVLMDYSTWAGSYTPSATSTFGIHIYSLSLNTAYIDLAEVYEVDAE